MFSAVLSLGGRLCCRHVSARELPVVSAAVCRSGPGWGEDSGEPLEARVGPSGEPDPGSPHRPARLGGGGVEGGAEWPAGNEPGSDPSSPRIWREVRSWRSGRWDMSFTLMLLVV